MIENFKEKLLKGIEIGVHSCTTEKFSENPENFQENVHREAETCGITKNRFYRNVFLQSWTKGCREIH